MQAAADALIPAPAAAPLVAPPPAAPAASARLWSPPREVSCRPYSSDPTKRPKAAPAAAPLPAQVSWRAIKRSIRRDIAASIKAADTRATSLFCNFRSWCCGMKRQAKSISTIGSGFMAKRMVHQVTIKDAKLVALIDTGATHNFMSKSYEERSGILKYATVGNFGVAKFATVGCLLVRTASAPQRCAWFDRGK